MACTNCGFKAKFCTECGTKLEIPFEKELSKDHTEPDLSSAVGLEEYKLIVYGLTGSGVSSTVNTLLGTEQMETKLSFDPITKTCCLQKCERQGYQLKVVDVPGFNAETSSNPEIDRFGGLKNGIELLTPGPNVLILVTPVDRYNAETHFLVSCLQCLEGIAKYTIIVFTKVDKTENPITREEITMSENLQDILALSEGRFQLFDNTSKDDKQVQALMDLVKQITNSNENKYFDNSIFCTGYEEKLHRVVAQREHERKDVSEETCMHF
ncbi:GTPase IMAP family member 9-like isoform X2 [Mytilus edulis]|uniref:GTPase IMAP family member 9-like isoform X2 n=1 Tax=Mytilus edulis TaxID=6550 RepID=UPI0039EF9270